MSPTGISQLPSGVSGMPIRPDDGRFRAGEVQIEQCRQGGKISAQARKAAQLKGEYLSPDHPFAPFQNRVAKWAESVKKYLASKYGVCPPMAFAHVQTAAIACAWQLYAHQQAVDLAAREHGQPAPLGTPTGMTAIEASSKIVHYGRELRAACEAAEDSCASGAGARRKISKSKRAKMPPPPAPIVVQSG